MRDVLAWCRHPLLLQVLVDSVTIPGFDDLMISEAMRLLEDNEVRVRLAVGQLLRSLAAKHGLTVLQSCQDTVLNSIHTHFVSFSSSRNGRSQYVSSCGRFACQHQQINVYVGCFHSVTMLRPCNIPGCVCVV